MIMVILIWVVTRRRLIPGIATFLPSFASEIQRVMVMVHHVEYFSFYACGFLLSRERVQSRTNFTKISNGGDVVGHDAHVQDRWTRVGYSNLPNLPNLSGDSGHERAIGLISISDTISAGGGKVAIVGNSFPAEVDFGRSAGFYVQ
mmetsp:Transcript_24306/g.24726  ORF Transcript_24306/g.24726 Transcript_24306/m.24726 type:complete len:146 (-) Transcript_24306:400-837(-)